MPRIARSASPDVLPRVALTTCAAGDLLAENMILTAHPMFATDECSWPVRR